MIHFHMQRFKIIGFVAIEVHCFRKRRWKTWTKCGNDFFKYYVHITSQHNHIFLYTGPRYHEKSEINFKLKVKMNKIYMVFNGDRP